MLVSHSNLVSSCLWIFSGVKRDTDYFSSGKILNNCTKFMESGQICIQEWLLQFMIVENNYWYLQDASSKVFPNLLCSEYFLNENHTLTQYGNWFPVIRWLKICFNVFFNQEIEIRVQIIPVIYLKLLSI